MVMVRVVVHPTSAASRAIASKRMGMVSQRAVSLRSGPGNARRVGRKAQGHGRIGTKAHRHVGTKGKTAAHFFPSCLCAFMPPCLPPHAAIALPNWMFVLTGVHPGPLWSR